MLTYACSVNGNALYRLGSPCFHALLQRARRMSYNGRAFDMALQTLVHDSSRFAEQQHFLHRILYSDYIRNYGDGHSIVNVTYLRQIAPLTYFVHSKLAFYE